MNPKILTKILKTKNEKGGDNETKGKNFALEGNFRFKGWGILQKIGSYNGSKKLIKKKCVF